MMHIGDDVLQAYLDGELGEDEAGSVARHLQGCTACATRLESLERLYRLVESLPDRPLETDLTFGVLARLAPAPALSRRVRWVLLAELGLGVGSLAAALGLMNWSPPAWFGELSDSLRVWPSPSDLWLSWAGLQASITSGLEAAQSRIVSASAPLASVLSATGWAAVLGALVLACLLVNGVIFARMTPSTGENRRSA